MSRPRILFGIVFVAVILGALFLHFIPRAPQPLTYRGRSIDYWFAQLPVTPIPPPGVDLGNVRGFIKSMGQQYGSTNLSDDASLDAFAAIGTNALPFLLARLHRLDSVVEEQITKVATNAGAAYLPFRKAEVERLQAVTGLIYAKTLTSEARELLVSLRTNKNSDIAAAAAYVLKRRAALGEPESGDSARNAESDGAANGSRPFR